MELARAFEDQQRTYAAIRYGSVFRLGGARVVLNPDAPLATANFAAGLDCSPALAELTLQRLPEVFDEAGVRPAILLDSPSSLPELGLLAEETGWDAVEESSVMVLTRPALLLEGEPGRIAVPVAERYEADVASVLADGFEYAEHVERALGTVVGLRLDDPRTIAMGAVVDGELVAVAMAFADGRLGYVSDVAVRPEHRRRSLGRAVASAAAAACLARGASTVWLAVEAGGRAERFWTGLGFEAAYGAVTYRFR